MISKQERIILNKLLDKFEKSKSFIGDNKVKQRFSIKILSLFSQYDDHSNYEVFQSVNEAIDILVRKGLIYATINSAKVCSEVSFNLDEIKSAYAYLGRVQKKDLNNSILELLDNYKDKNEILKRFCEAQIERINTNRPIQVFNGDLREFESILIAGDELLKIDSETFARDFSVRIFKDSKIFDRISSKVVNMLFEYGDFPEKEQVLANLNIVRNPTYVNFKGEGIIEISGQMINLCNFRSDIAISSSMLPDVDKIEITGKSVMTIENLTSFHSMDGKGMFLIYLGGFHNRVRREFIKKIYQQNPDIPFFHFGDIDAGGFYIFEHLKNQTGIDFLPYKMDLETLKKHRDYSKKLTENDRDRLNRLKNSQFAETVEFMLKNDCKLEQEAINLKLGNYDK
ncbi:MAG: DUF2220 family protein [Eubacteriales bacterium]|nr:DUF2220 family protein [Eubacteriales bacterium]